MLLLCVVSLKLSAQTPPSIVFQPVINGLSAPVDIVNAADGSNRIFVVQQGGTVKAYDQFLNFIDTFVRVTGIIFIGNGDERGLLSMAFDPNYASNGHVFVYYSSSPNSDVTIARYTRSATNPNRLDTTTRVVLLTIPKPPDGAGGPLTNHNGGKLNFGPEGFLYFATGDGGSQYDPFNNAQDGTTLRGKMIRLNVNNPNPPYYFIPPDNPYVTDPNIRDEIWALGLRNPWRWSFDRLTHDMWIGDVGQSAREEVDFRPAGSTGGINYGWKCFEGMIRTPGQPVCNPVNYVPPIFDYTHADGMAITGGYVYRGSEFPTLYGYYVTGDWSSGNIWLLHSDGSSSRQPSILRNLTTFGEAEDGTLYVAAGSSVYKVEVAAEAPTPIKLLSFTLKQEQAFNDLNWQTAMEYNVKEFRIQYSADAINFTDLTSVTATNNQNGSSYSFKHFTNNDKKIYYRLNTIDNDGKFELSKVISTSEKTGGPSIRILSSSQASMWIEISSAVGSITIVNAYGQIIQRINKINGSGIINLNTSNWNKGIYFLTAQDGTKHTTIKFLKD